MRSTIPTVAAMVMAGAALLVSACSSGAPHAAPAPRKPATKSSGYFKAGPRPCQLVTPQDILTVRKERMAHATSSRSTCSYANASTSDSLTITTAKMSRRGAQLAVASAARTAKGKVWHLHGFGGPAVAYLTITKTRSTATCLFAKNGTFVFLVAGSPHARLLTQEAITLARKAASRT